MVVDKGGSEGVTRAVGAEYHGTGDGSTGVISDVGSDHDESEGETDGLRSESRVSRGGVR